MSAAEQKKLVANLRHEFFEVAVHDEPLAIILQAQCDLLQEGDFARAQKTTRAIAARLHQLTKGK